MLYIGLDVHKDSWKVSIATETREHKTFTQAPDPVMLVNYLRKHFPGGHYRCVYEAGFSGFSTARVLKDLGVACMVVNPADIPTTNREKASKNDKVDARRLVRELRSGNMKPICIPSVVAVEDRALVRQRRGIVKKLSRNKTQIRMLLFNLGVKIPEDIVDKYWSRIFITWIGEQELSSPSGTEALQSLLRELLFLRSELLLITRKIRALSRTDAYADSVALLCGIPGIGMITAMVLLCELVDIARFANTDRLASYVGLIPREHSSGNKVHFGKLTHRSNTHLRNSIIEAAWIASRNDPALLALYENAARRMSKTKAIVIVARRLLNRIRFVLTTGEAYQLGVRETTWSKRRNGKPEEAKRPGGPLTVRHADSSRPARSQQQ
ncbi:MAG: IS110 family transposase [Bacteroidetes bacterium]|nr:IS110 family transposase [Bacteroidota bacterium]